MKPPQERALTMLGPPPDAAAPVPVKEAGEGRPPGDDMAPEAIRRFVARVLTLTGCRVDPKEDGTLLVALTRPWVDLWQCPPLVELSFELSQKERRPQSHLLVPGSPWLDDLIQWGREQGAVGGLFYAGVLDQRLAEELGRAVGERAAVDRSAGDGARAGGAPAAAFARALRRVGAANARMTPSGWSLVFQRQLLLAFRVTFMADEVKTLVVQTLIDPVTEESVSLPGGVRWWAFPLGGKELAAGPGETALDQGDRYRLHRLYRAGKRALPGALREPFHAFCRQVEQRRQREEDRLRQYFEQLASQAGEPLWRWMHQWEKQQWRARFWSHGPVQAPPAPPAALEAAREALERIEQERARRLEELELRYRVRVQAQLAYAAVVIVPRVEVTWRCTHPRRRSLVTFFDLLRARWVDWTCEVCQKGLDGCTADDIAVLDDGTVACHRCWAPCAGCRRPLPADSSAPRCHLCDDPLCTTCARRCPLEPVAEPLRLRWLGRGPASRRATPGELQVCPACHARVCSVCLGLALWGTGLRG